MTNKRFCALKLKGLTVLADLMDPLKTLFLELTTRCNMNCVMCVRRVWKEELADMELKLLRRIIEDCRRIGVRNIWFGGYGEPLFYEHFEEAAELVKKSGMWLGLVTNGSLLEEFADFLRRVSADRVVVSIDGVSEETYKAIRGFNVHKVFEGVRKLLGEDGNRRPEVWFSFVMMKNNMDELPKLMRVAHESGVTSIFVSNVLPHTEEVLANAIYTDDGAIASAKSIIDFATKRVFSEKVRLLLPRFEIKTERSCDFIDNHACAVTWDGKVTPCYNFMHTYPCYIGTRKKYIKQISFGSLTERTLAEIWKSEEYVKFRAIVRLFHFPSCYDCEFQHGCWFVEENVLDCWGNSPSCADCLWARKVIKCPF